MTNLTDLNLREAREQLCAKKISAHELVSAHIDKMEQTRSLNCFIHETPEQAIQAAKKIDQQHITNDSPPLLGIPILHKDLFCTKDIQTTAGSRMLKDFIPRYSAHVVDLLAKSGAVMLGKTNLDEFAMGSANITSAFGPVINPWKANNQLNVDLVPGGSSGGSAAAIAAGVGLVATGTDTGGSIRQPASFTGTFGIKPTYGRCSRWGIIAFASSLDQAGVFARNVRDGALVLSQMAGFDSRDSTSLDVAYEDYLNACDISVKGMRIGIAREYHENLPEDILKLTQKGQEWLKAQGAELVEVSLPLTRYALACYYVLAPAECSSNLARYDGVRYGLRVDAPTLEQMYEATRAEGFGAEVKRRILTGTYVLSAGYYDAYFRKAQKIRTRIKQDFNNVFEKVDLLLSPSTPGTAFTIDNPPKNPIEMYLNDVFTVPASLAGLPAASIPCGLSGAGLPIGLQLLAPPLGEKHLFTGAAALEQAANFQPISYPG